MHHSLIVQGLWKLVADRALSLRNWFTRQLSNWKSIWALKLSVWHLRLFSWGGNTLNREEKRRSILYYKKGMEFYKRKSRVYGIVKVLLLAKCPSIQVLEVVESVLVLYIKASDWTVSLQELVRWWSVQQQTVQWLSKREKLLRKLNLSNRKKSSRWWSMREDCRKLETAMKKRCVRKRKEKKGGSKSYFWGRRKLNN